MKRLFALVLILISFLGFESEAQITEAKVVYDYTIYWNKIYREMPFLSQAEKDRELLTWGNREGYTTHMNLYFTKNKSLYTYGEENEDQTYSWRKDEYLIYRDIENQTLIDFEETLGKTYVTRDSMRKLKWRVMNELKEIQGHLCMKAVTKDTIKNIDIEAWFAADIPVSTGPEKFYGLPGLILGMNFNNGDVIIEASSITEESVEDELKLPRKMKAKEITLAEMDKLIDEHIATSMKAQRNPYWSMRY